MKELSGGIISGVSAYYYLNYLQDKTNNLIVITKTLADEAKLLEDLKFYLKNNKQFKQLELLNLPSYELLFYDNSEPTQNIVATRIKTLNKLLTNKRQYLLVVSLETILFRFSPIDFTHKFNFNLSVGDELDLIQFSKNLVEYGYLRVSKISEQLDFALRGGVLDIFPAGVKNPIRIDLFDNEITDIRIFNVSTQRSIKKVDRFNLLSAKEFNFDQESREIFLANHKQIIGKKDEVFNKVASGLMPNGSPFYLPLFFNQMSSFFDYLLGDKNIISYEEGLSAEVDRILMEIDTTYESAKTNLDRIPLPVNTLFLAKNEFFSYLGNVPNLVLNQYKNDKGANFDFNQLPSLQIQERSLKFLKDFLISTKSRVLIVCASHSRISILLDLITEVKLEQVDNFYEFLQHNSQICITLGEISAGFNFGNITIINEAAIFGNTLSGQTRKRRAKHKDFISSVKNLIEINQGDFVVHEGYGIGCYLGLKTTVIDEIKQDLIELEYLGGAKLLIPVDEIDLLSKYAGGNNPSLNKLGSQKWSQAKAKALKAMYDIASELLAIYAKRELATGYQISGLNNEYDKFITQFPFVETEDQISATNDVIKDLASDKPMDRLICGDVGFGKTEIAMRAAFLSVMANYQVIILTPTTLLASQHYHSFVERFSGFAVEIAEISRFKTIKEQQEIKQKLQDGKIDIVIGTHKLLQKDIKYHNLGLIIIDEEHRFGVRQKESLKEIKDKCNILAMSATPIPRTLSLALNDLRQMSIIATPPMGRTKVNTFVKKFNKDVITQAVKRELHRSGQVFFVHNDIDSIDKIADNLNEFLPEVNIRIAHGRMSPNELEHIMSDFYHQRFEILVCTTIIETGIDVPTANTIIINNAGNFGLSQLHQLRGRVGRSHHQAYAYLLVKSFETISDDAKKRLEAISSLEEIGSGFNLANYDLEIRGAGDILGKNQSGKISEIGYSLYYDLLNRTISSIKQNRDISEITKHKITINLGISTIIPSDYVSDVHERLEFYAKIKNTDNLDEIKMELIDRFGLLPMEAKNLFASYELRALCERVGILSINAFNDRVLIEFDKDAQVDFAKIINLIQTQPQEYKLKNNNTLSYFYKNKNDLERIDLITNLITDVKIT
jgi:transcription-repair coupling factor (superfamily II helicase)